MTYLDDVTGHIISYNGVTVPNRKRLRFYGPGVSVQDDPGTNATRCLGVAAGYDDLPQTFNERSGPVVAVAGDYSGGIVNSTVAGGLKTPRLTTEIWRLEDDAYLNWSYSGSTRPLRYFADGGTVVTDDLGATLLPASSTDSTLNLDTNVSWPLGSVFRVLQANDEPITVVAQNSTVIGMGPGRSPTTTGQGTYIELRLIAADTWIVRGQFKRDNIYWNGFFQDVVGETDENAPIEEDEQSGGFSITGLTSINFPQTGVYRVTFSLSRSTFDPGASLSILPTDGNAATVYASGDNYSQISSAYYFYCDDTSSKTLSFLVNGGFGFGSDPQDEETTRAITVEWVADALTF